MQHASAAATRLCCVPAQLHAISFWVLPMRLMVGFQPAWRAVTGESSRGRDSSVLDRHAQCQPATGAYLPAGACLPWQTQCPQTQHAPPAAPVCMGTHRNTGVHAEQARQQVRTRPTAMTTRHGCRGLLRLCQLSCNRGKLFRAASTRHTKVAACLPAISEQHTFACAPGCAAVSSQQLWPLIIDHLTAATAALA